MVRSGERLVSIGRAIWPFDGTQPDTAGQSSAVPPVGIGVPAVDRTLGGLRAGDVLVVAYEPGTGATALCLQMARRAAQSHWRRVLISSTGDPVEVLGARLHSAEARLPRHRLPAHDLTEPEWRRYWRALHALKDLPVTLHSGGHGTLDALRLFGQLPRMHPTVDEWPPLLVCDGGPGLDGGDGLGRAGAVERAVCRVRGAAVALGAVIVLTVRLPWLRLTVAGVPDPSMEDCVAALRSASHVIVITGGNQDAAAGRDARFRAVNVWPAHTPTGMHVTVSTGFIPEWGLFRARASDLDDPRLDFDDEELGLPYYDWGDGEGWNL